MGVYVNTDGERFVNEGLGSSLVNQEIMQQHTSKWHLILDEGVRDIIRATPFVTPRSSAATASTITIELGMIVGGGVDLLRGPWREDRVDTVTASASMPAHGGHRQRVQRSGGSGNRGGPARPHQGSVPATALTTPPFYAIPMVGGIMATFGGLKSTSTRR